MLPFHELVLLEKAFYPVRWNRLFPEGSRRILGRIQQQVRGGDLQRRGRQDAPIPGANGGVALVLQRVRLQGLWIGIPFYSVHQDSMAMFVPFACIGSAGKRG